MRDSCVCLTSRSDRELERENIPTAQNSGASFLVPEFKNLGAILETRANSPLREGNFPDDETVGAIVATLSFGEENMYVLIFAVCSIVHGANCRELSPLPLDANTQVIGCAVASQVEAQYGEGDEGVLQSTPEAAIDPDLKDDANNLFSAIASRIGSQDSQ